VPLKKPEPGEQEPRREQTERIPWHISRQLTSVGHIREFNGDTVVEEATVSRGGDGETKWATCVTPISGSRRDRVWLPAP
jgi:hypothetical protein